MRKFIPALALVLLLMGCAKNTSTPIPGAANTFDSQSYLSLVTADSVIETTKADLAAGKFPASIAGNVKTALNALIQSYDVANPVYVAYHNAALAGTATTAQQTAVTTALSDVTAKTSALTSAKGAN
jgi:hypothetical protein